MTGFVVLFITSGLVAVGLEGFIVLAVQETDERSEQRLDVVTAVITELNEEMEQPKNLKVERKW